MKDSGAPHTGRALRARPRSRGFAACAVLCADGTRPVFYWDAGSGPGRNSWIIYAGQGGANCSSVQEAGKPDCWQLYLEDRTHFNNGLNGGRR